MYRFVLIWRLTFGQPASAVCAVSVMLGVATLVAVNAVMEGFEDSVRGRLREAGSDVAIESKSIDGFPDAAAKMSTIRDLFGERIDSISAVLECPAMLLDRTAGETGRRTWTPVKVVGCDHCDAGIVLSKRIGDVPPIGTTIALATVRGEFSRAAYSSFVVVAHTDTTALDGPIAYVPLADVQDLRDLPGRVSSLHMALRDPRERNAVKQLLRESFQSDDIDIKTWEDRYEAILRAVTWERGILNVMLFFVLVAAAFSILAIFSLQVMQQRPSIAILKALGAGDRGIATIFIGRGLLLGITGSLLGLAMGAAVAGHIAELARWLNGGVRPQFEFWMQRFDDVPTRIRAVDALVVAGLATGLAALFSVLPAQRAAKIAPAVALKGK